MRITSIIVASLTVTCVSVLSVGDSSAQGIRYPGGELKWGRDGRVNYPGGAVNWGYGNGYVNFPGGSVNWTNRGNGGVRISVPGFNSRIRW
ncbi:MAG: hypothetical protein V1897_19885 [Pseudomonadota bacterium]